MLQIGTTLMSKVSLTLASRRGNIEAELMSEIRSPPHEKHFLDGWKSRKLATPLGVAFGRDTLGTISKLRNHDFEEF